MLERVCREADIDEIASNENSISTAFSVEGNSGINEGRSGHRRAKIRTAGLSYSPFKDIPDLSERYRWCFRAVGGCRDTLVNSPQDRMQWKSIVICGARQHLDRTRIQPLREGSMPARSE
jgi:hypothetical protein